MKKSKSNKNFLTKFNSIPTEIDQRVSTETEIKSNHINFLENLLNLIKIQQSQFFNNLDNSNNFTIKSLIQFKNNLNRLFISQKEIKNIYEERKKNLLKKLEKKIINNEKNYEIESLSNFNFTIYFDILCLNYKIINIKNQIKNFKNFKSNEIFIETLNEIIKFDDEFKNIEKDLNQELKDLKEFSEFQKIEINETIMKLNKMKEILKKSKYRKKYINSEEIIDEEIENYLISSNNFHNYMNSNLYENTVNVISSSENNNFEFKDEENEIIENLENGEKIKNLNINNLVNLNMNINVNINVTNNNNNNNNNSNI